MSGIDSLTKDQKAQQYWVERLVAFIIDAIIVYVVLFVITLLVTIPAILGGAGVYAFVFGGISLLWGLLFVLYFTFMEAQSGASIGKRFFHLKVVSKTNANPNFTEAFIRNISKIYWILLLLDVIVGLATSKEYSQKYTDRLEGTKVVKA